MRKILFLAVIALPLLLQAKTKEVKLFNGKDLANWEIFTGTVGQQAPISLFSVVPVDGENMIRISGEINASLATKDEYENYHLRMVFRWGEKVFKQKNSGILYHSYGPFGDGLGVWMSSHELQLCTAKMGDSYCMGNSYFEIPANKEADGKIYRYSPDGTKSQFGNNFPAKNCAKKVDNEKPSGEWNVIDLYCYGRNAVHVVNGAVTVVNYNSGRIESDGRILPLTKGKIQIQSEGGELFIRSLTLEKIKEIPAELMKQ